MVLTYHKAVEKTHSELALPARYSDKDSRKE